MYNVILDTFINSAVGYIVSNQLGNRVDKPLMFIEAKKNNKEFKNVRNGFTENLIAVILKNIVNLDNLSGVFTNDSVTKEFHKVADKLLNKYLFRGKNKLKDLPEFRDIYFYCTDILNNSIRGNISRILSYPISHSQAGELFTKKQINHITGELYNNLVLVLDKTSYLETLSNEILENIRDTKITDIIPSEAIDIIYKNINNQDRSIINYIKENELSIFDSFFDNLIKTADINKHISEAKENIKNKPIKQFLSIRDSDITEYLANCINKFFNTKEAYYFCEDLYFSLVSYLMENKLTLRQNISTSYKEAFAEYFEKKVNNIAYSCTGWLRHNKDEIDKYINDTVDHNIKSAGLRKKYKNAIISNIGGLKFADSSVGEIFVELANSKKENLNDISRFILSETEQYIDNISITNIIELLEDEKVIGSQQLFDYIKANMTDNDFIGSVVEYILNLPMSTIFNDDIDNMITKTFKYLYIDFFENNIFLNNEFTKNITSLITKDIKGLKNKTFEQTMIYSDLEEVNANIKNTILNYVKINSVNIKNLIKEYLTKFIENKNIQDVLDCVNGINKAIDINICDSIKSKINKSNAENMDNLGNMRFKAVSEKINSLPEITENTSLVIQNLSCEIIVLMLNDYLSSSISSHYKNITDTEFVKFIEYTNPSSSKLKKASGLFTGGAIGIGASLLCGDMLNTSIISSVASWQGILTCGLTGIAANAASQLIIPKLHLKNSYFSKIPVLKNITDDFINAKKNNMAHYIISLTNESLYNSDKIRTSIDKESVKLKDHIYEILKKNDYEQLKSFLLSYTDYYDKMICDFIDNELSENSDFYIKSISTGFLSAPIKHAFDRNFNDRVSVKAAESAEIKENIMSLAKSYLTGTKSVLSIIPDRTANECKSIIRNYINDSPKKIFSFINDIDAFSKAMKAYGSTYSKNVQNRLNDIVDNDYIDDIKLQIYNHAYNKFILNDKLRKCIEKIGDKINSRIFIDCSLENILSKKTKLIATGMMNKYFGDIIHDFERIVLDNSLDGLEDQISGRLFNSLTAIEKKKYKEMDGDYILRNILSDVINLNIHRFIDDNIGQFYMISKDLLNQIYNISLSDLNIALDNVILKDSFMKLFSGEGQGFLANKFYFMSDKIAEDFDEITVADILRYVNMDSIGSVISNYGLDITRVNRNIYNSIIDNYYTIAQSFSDITPIYADIILKQMTNNVLFKNISRESCIKIKNNFGNTIKENDWIYFGVNSLLNKTYDYFDINDCLYDIFDREELQKYTGIIYKKTISDNEFKIHTRNVVDYMLKNEFFGELEECIPENIINRLIYFIASSINIDIHDSLPSLFSSVSMDEIINHGIQSIDISEYRAIYRCFNTTTRRNLLKSGIYGAISGLNKYIGMFLSFANIIKL